MLRVIFISLLFFAAPAFGKYGVLGYNPERTITLSGQIGNNSVREAHKLYQYAEVSKEYVTIVIDSPGGSVFAAYAILNIMRGVQANGVHIRCFVRDIAASAAFMILSKCDSRYGAPYSHYLWHAPRVYVTFGVLDTFQAERLLIELRQIERTLVKLLVDTLDIEKTVIMEHYEKETLFHIDHLRELDSKFITPVEGLRVQNASKEK
jgi:ATP-dependent protease ClpP protease subunit